MIQLQKITLREVNLPLKTPFKTASSITSSRRIFLLELVDATGLTNWSECVALETPDYLPETIDTAWLVIKNYLAPLVLNKRFQHPSEIDKVFNTNIKGHRMAKAAIEMGCWGLKALAEDKSLAEVLGATKTKVPTGVVIGIQKNPDELVKKVREKLVHHYHRIKIKIQPGADFDYIQAVRDQVKEEFEFAVDANGAYDMTQIDHLKSFDQFGLSMIEQPLGWDDLYEHSLLQKEIQTPVCLDESIVSLKKVEEMVALEAGQILNLKPGRVGGFTETLKIHEFCIKHKVPMWCGGMLESGVGRSYNVALTVLPGFTSPGDLSPSGHYWKRECVNPEWKSEKGWIPVRWQKKGIGVTIDTEYIDSITVKKEVVR